MDLFGPSSHFLMYGYSVIFVATKKVLISQSTFQDCTLMCRTENILFVAECIDLGCKHVRQRAFLLGCPKAIFESSDKCNYLAQCSLMKKVLKN